jgi:rhodanese-related sulfurtransferase
MTSTSSVKTSVINISPQEFVQLASPPQLIDVRSQLEYATGHVPTALNLSLPRILIGTIPILSRWILSQWFRDLPKNEPVAVICLTAHRSPIAAASLAKEGFTNVFNVTGGMMKWQHLGLETRTGK